MRLVTQCEVDTYQRKHQQLLVFSSTDISQQEPQMYKIPAMTKDQWCSGRGRERGEGREKEGGGGGGGGGGCYHTTVYHCIYHCRNPTHFCGLCVASQ